MSVAPTFPLREAAEAAQIPARTIRRWMDNNVITLRNNDLRAAGTGTPCGLSRNRILQLAVTEALLKSGVSLSSAAKAGFEFSDRGNAGRGAGQLFPHGKTILTIGGPNGPAVSNVDFSASVFDLSNCGVTICIDLNRIVVQVDNVLNNSH